MEINFTLIIFGIFCIGGLLFWIIRRDNYLNERTWDFDLIQKLINYVKRIGIDINTSDLKTISVLFMIPFFNIIYFVFILSIMIVLYINKKIKESDAI